MTRILYLTRLMLVLSVVLVVGPSVLGQKRSNTNASDAQFGPVMRAYLGYLRNEQEVVDDRISRREISPAYYRRNSERIRALRQTAIRLVSQSGNDYVPELEAVTVDEFSTLFEDPPKPSALRLNTILTNKFRYLGAVHPGETFYVFARLDPYEQAALMEQQQTKTSSKAGASSATGQPVGQTSGRPRRSVP